MVEDDIYKYAKGKDADGKERKDDDYKKAVTKNEIAEKKFVYWYLPLLRKDTNLLSSFFEMLKKEFPSIKGREIVDIKGYHWGNKKEGVSWAKNGKELKEKEKDCPDFKLLIITDIGEYTIGWEIGTRGPNNIIENPHSDVKLKCEHYSNKKIRVCKEKGYVGLLISHVNGTRELMTASITHIGPKTLDYLKVVGELKPWKFIGNKICLHFQPYLVSWERNNNGFEKEINKFLDKESKGE